MKVGIYNEPAEGAIGGAEISVAVLAEALAGNHQVDIIHHKPSVTREILATISGTNLGNVHMRHVASQPYSFGTGHNPVRRYEKARRWQAQLSEPYDLFINFTHGFPPFCHARRGALVVLFPVHAFPPARLASQNSSDEKGRFWNLLASAYHGWEWRKRLETYQLKTAISQFARTWTTRRWGVDCEVIHPPVDINRDVREKENLILSVGRFTATGHSKKQLEMMTAFGQLSRSAPGEWQYFSVGGLSDGSKDQEYFKSVDALTRDCPARLQPNIERGRLKQLYEKARIFWHAAGYGESEDRPELAEHFGIATVEAMSGGCVPIVVSKGGQTEIVEHGVSGFLWSTLTELKEYTGLLMRDEQLRARMGEAARARAELFSRERFVSRFRELLMNPVN